MKSFTNCFTSLKTKLKVKGHKLWVTCDLHFFHIQILKQNYFINPYPAGTASVRARPACTSMHFRDIKMRT